MVNIHNNPNNQTRMAKILVWSWFVSMLPSSVSFDLN